MSVIIKDLTALKKQYKDREEQLKADLRVGKDSETMSPEVQKVIEARASECLSFVYHLATLEYRLEKGYLPVEVTVGA